jgi:hypothetical protein
MIRLGERMKPHREPTLPEAKAIDRVLALARNYADLPAIGRSAFLAEIRALSTGRERHLTTRFTPPDHPDFGALMAMLDGLIATEADLIATRHGLFDADDLRAVGAMTRGRDLVVFPVRYPKTGPPLFRSDAERGPRVESFRTVPAADAPASPWVEDDAL